MTGRQNIAYFFIAPSMLILLLFTYLPMPYALILALSKSELGTGKLQFVGLANFKTLLQDKYFWESLFNTFKYALTATFSLLFLGLVLALIFNQKFYLRSFYITVLLVPWVVSQVVTGLTWRWLFNENFGLLNYLFQPIGLKPSLLTTVPRLALFSIVIITIWQRIPYSTLLILAGLQTISNDIIEAAKIDGAPYGQILLQIILPLLKSTLLIVGLLLVIWCFAQTGAILVLTKGGPLRATETLSVYMYKEAFQNYHLTNAASIAVVLALINVTIALFYLLLKKQKS